MALLTIERRRDAAVAVAAEENLMNKFEMAVLSLFVFAWAALVLRARCTVDMADKAALAASADTAVSDMIAVRLVAPTKALLLVVVA